MDRQIDENPNREIYRFEQTNIDRLTNQWRNGQRNGEN